MRNHIPIFMLLSGLLLFQCKKMEEISGSGKDIFIYTWGTHDQVYIENNKFHSYKYLDTLENQLKGDTLMPTQFIGKDQVVIQQLVPTSMKMMEIEGMTEYVITQAHFLPDTFTYATKKYIDKQFLLLYSNTSTTRIFELKTKEVEVPEIRPDYQPRFLINGYSVGDKIARDQVEIIYSDIFGNRVTEEAYLTGNENIKLTILGYEYIEKIEKANIPDGDLNTLVRSIDKIFTKAHEYEEIENGSEEMTEIVKGYYWNEKDVSIILQKIERPWENQETDSWTLESSNYVISTILENYLEITPENL